MAYVDLSPVGAGITTLPETSEVTAIQERIEQWGGRGKATQKRVKAPESPKKNQELYRLRWQTILNWLIGREELSEVISVAL